MKWSDLIPFKPTKYDRRYLTPFVSRMETGLHAFFLVTWLVWMRIDISHHDKWAVFWDLIFLAHRIWCAYRWWKFLKDSDDDDDQDGGHRKRVYVPLWKQVLMGA